MANVFNYTDYKETEDNDTSLALNAKNRYRSLTSTMEYSACKIKFYDFAMLSLCAKTNCKCQYKPKRRSYSYRTNNPSTSPFSHWRETCQYNIGEFGTKWSEDILCSVGVKVLEVDDHENCHFRKLNPVVLKDSIRRLGDESETFEPETNDSDLPSTSNVNYCVTYRGLGEDLVLHNRKRANNPRGINYSAHIADEVILNIFTFLSSKDLSRCAQVCTRWKTISYDETLWRKIDLKNNYLHSEMLGHVINRNVRFLRLASAKVEIPIFNSYIENSVESNVLYLDMSVCSISTSGIAAILNKSRQLKKLSLESCELNEAICWQIGENKNLEALNICMCSGINFNGILAIAQGCKKLREFNMSWIGACSYTFDLLTVHLTPAIQRLNIAGSKVALKDAHITLLADLCPNLRELDISDSLEISSPSIDVIVSKLVLLEHLHISHCYKIIPPKYIELKRLPFLKQLEAFGLFDEGALLILQDKLRGVQINKKFFSTIARPNNGLNNGRMWGITFNTKTD